MARTNLPIEIREHFMKHVVAATTEETFVMSYFNGRGFSHVIENYR